MLARAAAKDLTPRRDPIVSIAHLSPIKYTVKDTALRILDVLPDREPMSFQAMIAHVEDRIERIVYLLAVLELYKQGALEVEQFERFGDLTVSRRSNGFDVSTESFDDWNEDANSAELVEGDDWDLDEELGAPGPVTPVAAELA